jgi:hypothetical protein
VTYKTTEGALDGGANRAGRAIGLRLVHSGDEGEQLLDLRFGRHRVNEEAAVEGGVHVVEVGDDEELGGSKSRSEVPEADAVADSDERDALALADSGLVGVGVVLALTLRLGLLLLAVDGKTDRIAQLAHDTALGRRRRDVNDEHAAEGHGAAEAALSLTLHAFAVRRCRCGSALGRLSEALLEGTEEIRASRRERVSRWVLVVLEQRPHRLREPVFARDGEVDSAKLQLGPIVVVHALAVGREVRKVRRRDGRLSVTQIADPAAPAVSEAHIRVDVGAALVAARRANVVLARGGGRGVERALAGDPVSDKRDRRLVVPQRREGLHDNAKGQRRRVEQLVRRGDSRK